MQIPKNQNLFSVQNKGNELQILLENQIFILKLENVITNYWQML